MTSKKSHFQRLTPQCDPLKLAKTRQKTSKIIDKIKKMCNNPRIVVIYTNRDFLEENRKTLTRRDVVMALKTEALKMYGNARHIGIINAIMRNSRPFEVVLDEIKGSSKDEGFINALVEVAINRVRSYTESFKDSYPRVSRRRTKGYIEEDGVKKLLVILLETREFCSKRFQLEIDLIKEVKKELHGLWPEEKAVAA